MQNMFLICKLLVACEYPLYIRPHTKTVLLTALTNDSKFLGTQMVMDYSLLVGFDEEKRELVVGVIGKFLLLSRYV